MSAQADSGPVISNKTRNYTLAMLVAIYASSHVDRQIVSILAESIKLELMLSDTQLGFLIGLSFAIFYATLGIPIAYLADRMSRKKIIIASLTLFSVMTYACGLAQNYVQLLLARIGVGVGEAGTSPPSHAMIADMYSPSDRATPLAVFALGINLGLFVAFIAGGWIADNYGWRTAIQVIALPGFVLALIAWFTLQDPPRGMSDETTGESQAPPVMETVKHMWQTPSMRQLLIGSTLIIIVGYGAVAWLPSYFIRVHGMTATQVGTVLALMIGFGGAIGTTLGGVVADRLGKKDVRWNMWLVGIIGLIVAPFSVMGYLAGSSQSALLWLIVPTMTGALYFGPTLAMLHTLVKPEMRSLASAIMLFINNIFGLGIGPLSVGMMSDALAPEYGVRSLGIALALMVIIGLWGSIHYLLAGRSLARDIDAMQTA
ncbi:MAG: spinster family MFS transporter [Parvibaculales bacterium]